MYLHLHLSEYEHAAGEAISNNDLAVILKGATFVVCAISCIWGIIFVFFDDLYLQFVFACTMRTGKFVLFWKHLSEPLLHNAQSCRQSV